MNQVYTTSVAVQYRPIKIGWCIITHDTESILKAAKLSFCLWGGIYNPIIPVDNPKLADYLINNYKVDVLFNVNSDVDVKKFIEKYNYLPWPFDQESLFIYSFSGWQSQFLDIEFPSKLYSKLDLPGLLKELKPPLYIYEQNKDDDLSNLLSIWIGNVDNIHNNIDYNKILGNYFKIERMLSNKNDKLSSITDYLTLEQLSQLNLFPDKRNKFDNSGFYLGSVKSNIDLINYWNLRASDIQIYFYDHNYSERLDDLINSIVKKFSERPLKFKDSDKKVTLYYQAEPDYDIKIFGDSILKFHISPEIWNGLNLTPPQHYIQSKIVTATSFVEEDKQKYTIPLPEKFFAPNVNWSNKHLICSIHDIHSDYGKNPFTIALPYIPETNLDIGEKCTLMWREVRLGNDGIGKIIDLGMDTLDLYAIEKEEYFKDFFKVFGINAFVSKAGLIANRILNQFDGFLGCRIFRVEGVRDLISAYKADQTFNETAALSKICEGNINNQMVDKFSKKYSGQFILGWRAPKLEPRHLFNFLLDKNALRAGLDLKCPKCGLESWIILDTLKTYSDCIYCGNSFNVLLQLTKSKWAFRRSGIFGVDNNQEGAIPVILTMVALDRQISGIGERKLFFPSMKLTSSKFNLDCEVDLLFFCQDNFNIPELVIAECKSSGSNIEQKDVENLMKISDLISSSRVKIYLMFSKLSEFTTEETSFCKAAQEGHDYRVIMLTKRELEPIFMYSQTVKEHKDLNEHAISLFQMAANTNRIFFK